MLNPIQLSGGGRGFRHEIRVMNVRKAKASEYVKAECENFIFNPISTGGGVFHPRPSKWLRVDIHQMN